MLFDLDFWKASAERAIKTFVQTLAAGLGTASVGIVDLPWESALGLAASAAVLSLLTSVGSARVGKNAGPSLLGESTKPETVVVEVPAKKPAARKPSSSTSTPKKKTTSASSKGTGAQKAAPKKTTK